MSLSNFFKKVVRSVAFIGMVVSLFMFARTLNSIIGIAGSFLGMFAIWLIIAAVMHGLSAFFEGEGNLRRTFEFVGYRFTHPSLDRP